MLKQAIIFLVCGFLLGGSVGYGIEHYTQQKCCVKVECPCCKCDKCECKPCNCCKCNPCKCVESKSCCHK